MDEKDQYLFYKVREEKDQEKRFDAATDEWYKGMDQFNFNTGESKAPKSTSLND